MSNLIYLTLEGDIQGQISAGAVHKTPWVTALSRGMKMRSLSSA
jgi:type VI protein secretion system component Hcp